MFSVCELVYRAFIVYANLIENPANHRFTKSAAFATLDPSEKGAISYYFGLVAAKVLSQRCLNIPWLMHLQVYAPLLQPVIVGNLRPDLVGMDQGGDWDAVEAKGSSRQIRPAVVVHAKNQARALHFVGQNEPVVLHIASVAGFQAAGLIVRFEDPDERRRGRGLTLDLDRDDFTIEYYAEILALLDDQKAVTKTIARRKVRLARLPLLDISVGLDLEVLSVLRKRMRRGLFSALRRTLEPHWGRIRAASGEEPGKQILQPSPDRTENAIVAMDGVAIELGQAWNAQRMQLEPSHRE